MTLAYLLWMIWGPYRTATSDVARVWIGMTTAETIKIPIRYSMTEEG